MTKLFKTLLLLTVFISYSLSVSAETGFTIYLNDEEILAENEYTVISNVDLNNDGINDPIVLLNTTDETSPIFIFTETDSDVLFLEDANLTFDGLYDDAFQLLSKTVINAIEQTQVVVGNTPQNAVVSVGVGVSENTDCSLNINRHHNPSSFAILLLPLALLFVIRKQDALK